MRVIGTAGHIDHGKSSLVRALTGIDPDRLPEEKARGMTIELGFAWLDLDGDTVGIIDVPGHERFVRHMLAGVGGIDLALLVVAADEAVMPQTREHLAILDLLTVCHGVVALTKCDLVDEEWLALATEEVRVALAGSSLAGSPIVPCSSVSGAGLTELRAALRATLATTPPRPDRGRPHLPVDRVFTSDGYGTVVTGTLLDGSLAVGTEVEFAPGGPRGRIRGMQAHHRRLERAGPGRRLAVNVAGVEHETIARGMVVCLPGTMPPAHYLDMRLRVVEYAAAPGGHGGRRSRREVAAGGQERPLVSHGMAITLHTGAAEVQGTLRLLDADALGPDEEGWAQVRLETPIAALRGDRCVLRIPSPALTVAGGVIVAINPPRRRRFASAALARLAALATATPEERLLDVLAAGPTESAALATSADLPAAEALTALTTLRAAGAIVPLAPDSAASAYLTTPPWLLAARVRLEASLRAYHARYPLRPGMPGETLRGEFHLDRRAWSEVLSRWQTEEAITRLGDLVSLPDHRVILDAAQEHAAAALHARLAAQPFAPPSGAELGVLDPEWLSALLGRGDPVRLAEGILLTRAAYEEMRDTALALIDARGEVTVAMLRDRFGTSRKFALALLEYLDGVRLTRRLGDGRVRGPSAGSGAPRGR